MARRADVLCAGGCGQLIFRGRGSLEAGKATCRACRSARRRPKPVRTCRRCGIELLPKAGSSRRPSKQYCSEECRRQRTCEVCGKSYHPHATIQRTCSRACGQTIKVYKVRKRTPNPKIITIRIRWCIQCGAWFVARGSQRTCSGACAHEAKRAYDYAYNQRYRPPTNPDRCACGQPLSSRRRRKCDGCGAEARRIRKRRAKWRSRTVRREVLTEPYTLAEIAKRDHYRCGLCRKRVAMTQHVPHPKAPTVDHLLPLACGGDDTRANVQLAHFLCNSIKGDRGGHEQLALIG